MKRRLSKLCDCDDTVSMQEPMTEQDEDVTGTCEVHLEEIDDTLKQNTHKNHIINHIYTHANVKYLKQTCNRVET